MAIARRLAESTGLGRELCDAIMDLPAEALVQYLHGWCNQLRNELANDRLGCQFGQLASHVPDEFPWLDVLRQYAMPVTSGSTGKDLELRDVSRLWVPCCPNPGDLAGICQTLFAWGMEVDIWAKFGRHIWPGAILHSLLQVCRPFLLDSLNIDH
jgi:hypothetical protein